MSDSLLGDLENKTNIVEGKTKQQVDQQSKEEQDSQVNNQKKNNNTGNNEKVNRSYMLSKSCLSKLQKMKIQEADKTFSDLVEKAIDKLYKEDFK